MRGTRGKQLGEAAELAIFGPEIVAPLADAMRLVDGKERDVGIGDERAGSPAVISALGRDIEQIERRRAAARRGSRLAFVRRQRGIERLGAHPCWRSASTWSRIRAISGEMTMPTPGRQSAGTW